MLENPYLSKQLLWMSKSVDRYKGGTARLLEYFLSHKLLSIRITLPGIPGHLHIGCGDVTFICCPTMWENIDLKLEIRETGGKNHEYRLSDRGGEYFVTCGVIEIKQNVKVKHLPPNAPTRTD
jgi:hypothetical protein